MDTASNSTLSDDNLVANSDLDSLGTSSPDKKFTGPFWRGLCGVNERDTRQFSRLCSPVRSHTAEFDGDDSSVSPVIPMRHSHAVFKQPVAEPLIDLGAFSFDDDDDVAGDMESSSLAVSEILLSLDNDALLPTLPAGHHYDASLAGHCDAAYVCDGVSPACSRHYETQSTVDDRPASTLTLLDDGCDGGDIQVQNTYEAGETQYVAPCCERGQPVDAERTTAEYTDAVTGECSPSLLRRHDNNAALCQSAVTSSCCTSMAQTLISSTVISRTSSADGPARASDDVTTTSLLADTCRGGHVEPKPIADSAEHVISNTPARSGVTAQSCLVASHGVTNEMTVSAARENVISQSSSQVDNTAVMSPSTDASRQDVAFRQATLDQVERQMEIIEHQLKSGVTALDWTKARLTSVQNSLQQDAEDVMSSINSVDRLDALDQSAMLLRDQYGQLWNALQRFRQIGERIHVACQWQDNISDLTSTDTAAAASQLVADSDGRYHGTVHGPRPPSCAAGTHGLSLNSTSHVCLRPDTNLADPALAAPSTRLAAPTSTATCSTTAGAAAGSIGRPVTSFPPYMSLTREAADDSQLMGYVDQPPPVKKLRVAPPSPSLLSTSSGASPPCMSPPLLPLRYSATAPRQQGPPRAAGFHSTELTARPQLMLARPGVITRGPGGFVGYASRGHRASQSAVHSGDVRQSSVQAATCRGQLNKLLSHGLIQPGHGVLAMRDTQGRTSTASLLANGRIQNADGVVFASVIAWCKSVLGVNSMRRSTAFGQVYYKGVSLSMYERRYQFSASQLSPQLGNSSVPVHISSSSSTATMTRPAAVSASRVPDAAEVIASLCSKLVHCIDERHEIFHNDATRDFARWFETLDLTSELYQSIDRWPHS